jgi:hypothetical protein
MKFEKFLKQVGTHGTVIERNESEKWLVCDGVGMVIPRGVDNLLGTPIDSEYASIVDVIANADYDDPVKLVNAVLLDPTGNAKSIYRIFETDLGDTVAIINADYGLLEKSDLLGYGEIELEDKETGDKTTVKYLLAYDYNGNILGFITGSNKF